MYFDIPQHKKNRLARAYYNVILSSFSLLLLCGCFSNEVKPTSIESAYYRALFDAGVSPGGSTSMENLQKIVTDFPGTKYASLATLRIAEINFWQISNNLSSNELKSTDIYYKYFLVQNPYHYLTTYTLYRLAQISYIKSKIGLFVSGSDPTNYEEGIEIFKKFEIFYPDSIYFDEIENIAIYSVDKLASHEESIGDWYFKKDIYAAAANRYKYILTNYPYYENTKMISQKLIAALKRNLQFEESQEYQKSYDQLYGN